MTFIRTSEQPLDKKWNVLLLLSLAELLAMGAWFSASAVTPALTTAWNLNESGRAWLTMSVQIGFVAGSLGSALLNLADRVPAKNLFSVSAFLAAFSTLLIPISTNSLAPALILRFFTGFFLAGVYPVGMKIMATWTKADRGLGIGLLVGALTLGSASPHLVNALGGMQDWRFVLFLSGGLSALGGMLVLFIYEGPYKAAAPRFNWKYAVEVFRVRELRLANFGYLGHMWELFAMWSWIAVFLVSSFHLSGVSSYWGSLAAFAAIGAGGVGSLLAGILADRIGRTTITIWSMGISGACCLLVGFLYGGSPILLTLLCLVWGFAIVADSAQFSAAVSELAEKEYIGTALTLQTSLGFLLTLVTIRLVPTLESWLGWQWAFVFLALGPLAGIWAMLALRGTRESVKLAGGKK